MVRTRILDLDQFCLFVLYEFIYVRRNRIIMI